MVMSSEERRRRVHRAVNAQRSASSRGTYRNNSYDDTGAQGRGETYVRDDFQSASSRRPAGASMQQSGRGRGRAQGGRSTAGRSAASRRRSAARRRRRRSNLPQLLLLVLFLAVLAGGVVFAVKGIKKWRAGRAETETEVQTEAPAETTAVPETTVSPITEKLSEAARLAAMYDYDAAIALLNEDPSVAADPEAQMAVAEYEQIKTTLVRQDISEITHVFFHSLIVDAENAFDKSKWGAQSDGYNQVMTTIPEFCKMLEELYADGYVLVQLHDMASMQVQEDGSEKMVAGDIMLPPGKKGIVMSQDDVCYYEYMEGAGFADRIIVGEDGRPTTVYIDENGNELVGEYDLVPILDRFVDEHPDFSYRGAKACLAFTGYNGILGYRTDETYDASSEMYDPEKTANPNIEADRETARQVAKALIEDGYELASHSWGHRNYTNISQEHLQRDADRWERNVNQALLEGKCDIILFPFGADVGDWRPYSHDNAKFDYLWDLGFRYFCNVDSAQYWVQRGDDYLRQGRRNLDGYIMWQDIANGKGKLNDLFDDVSAIFDPARPTPVPDM